MFTAFCHKNASWYPNPADIDCSNNNDDNDNIILPGNFSRYLVYSKTYTMSSQRVAYSWINGCVYLYLPCNVTVAFVGYIGKMNIIINICIIFSLLL